MHGEHDPPSIPESTTWDRQARLQGLLREASDTLGEHYAGILYALDNPLMPNRLRVAAYQARELMTLAPQKLALPGILQPAKPRSLVALRNELQVRFDLLKTALEIEVVGSRMDLERYEEFTNYLEGWLSRTQESRRDKRTLIRSYVATLERAHLAPGSRRSEIICDQWMDLEGYFNAVLHGRTSPIASEMESRITGLEDFFLSRLCPRTFEDQAALDRFVQQVPSRLSESDSDYLLKLIETLDANYRYFFRKLDTPDWIGYLEEKGFFKQPPALEQLEDRILVDDWLELRYLERMARLEPIEVGRIAREISHLHADNPRVHEALIGTAIQLFPEARKHAKKLLNSELNWIADQPFLQGLLPEKLAKAALAAASASCSGTALRTARGLLALEVSDAGLLAIHESAWLRMGEWNAKGVLEDLVHKVLPEIDPTLQLELLSNLITFLDLVGKQEFGDENPNLVDAAFQMWRPAIEEHSQNDLNSIASSAIEAVRDAADALVPSHGVLVFQALEESTRATHFRISLFLRQKHSHVDPDGTAGRLSDPAVLENVSLRHELFELLESVFDTMPGAAQVTYLKWIDNQDDAYKQQLYLWPIRKELSGPRLELYRKLKEEYGGIEHPDMPMYHEVGWIGPTSPFSADEMGGMDIPEVVEKLNSWEHTRGWRAPEPEGLARELAVFAAKDAKRVSEQATAFEELQQPTCVRGIVQGLVEAVKEGRSVSWEPVLHLCEWAVEQERGDEPEGSGLEEFDRTWGPARKQIAWLLRRGTEESAAEIPFELRDDVWCVLRELVHDPDPTEEEERSRSEHYDPSTLAINVVRGVALGGTLSFALWVARHNQQEVRTWCLLGLEELGQALEERLAEDQSPAIRSLFGRWLPYLFRLDQEWTVSNVGRIFPIDENNEAIWIATWDAYLVFCDKLHIEFLDLLRTSYERALDRLGTERREKTRIANPDERFGHHLVLFYREGVLAPEDPLFTTFFEKADAKLRYSVMADAVRLVQDIAGEKRGPAISRLQDLWERRCKTAIGERPDEYHELSSFGWWFLKDDFPPEWRLQQLLETQRNRIRLELDGRVLEMMINLSEEHIPLVLDCLEAIVRNPASEDWGMYDDHVKEILRAGLSSGDTKLHDKAENLVHYIGSLGFLSFRDLLLDSDTEDNGDTQ